MNVKEFLFSWVSGPSRNYLDGVRLFELLAAETIKKRYLAFFREVSFPHGNDPHFTMLLDKLSRIAQQVRVSPGSFPALGQILDTSDGIPVQHSSSPAAPSSDYNAPIVIHAKDLPKNEAGYYARIQEIFPLIGALHGQLSSESLTDGERKDIADEIVSLDDERRSLWDKIDNFIAGRPSEFHDRPEYSEDKFVRGLQIAVRIKQVKQNISTTKGSISKFTKEGNEKALKRAQDRLARYENELSELEAEVVNAETESSVSDTVPES